SFWSRVLFSCPEDGRDRGSDGTGRGKQRHFEDDLAARFRTSFWRSLVGSRWMAGGGQIREILAIRNRRDRSCYVHRRSTANGANGCGGLLYPGEAGRKTGPSDRFAA